MRENSMQDELALIAQNGILRVAINTGNRALVQNDGGELAGVSPALAQRLADRLGVTFEPVHVNRRVKRGQVAA
jgi:polar amino acid transport system substrate-binding protein